QREGVASVGLAAGHRDQVAEQLVAVAGERDGGGVAPAPRIGGRADARFEIGAVVGHARILSHREGAQELRDAATERGVCARVESGRASGKRPGRVSGIATLVSVIAISISGPSILWRIASARRYAARASSYRSTLTSARP